VEAKEIGFPIGPRRELRRAVNEANCENGRWASKNKPLQIFRLVEELEMEME